MMGEINLDGVVGIVQMYPGWIYIRWINPGTKKKTFLKYYKFVERLIRKSNLKGWICYSMKHYTIMHELIKKYGGVIYAEDENMFFFKKEIL